MKRNVLLGLLLSASLCSTAQLHVRPVHALMVTNDYEKKDQVYKLNPAVDIPVTLATAGATLYGFSVIYSKDPSAEHEIQNLKKSDINSFDRWAAGMHSQK